LLNIPVYVTCIAILYLSIYLYINLYSAPSKGAPSPGSAKQESLEESHSCDRNRSLCGGLVMDCQVTWVNMGHIGFGKLMYYTSLIINFGVHKHRVWVNCSIPTQRAED